MPNLKHQASTKMALPEVRRFHVTHPSVAERVGHDHTEPIRRKSIQKALHLSQIVCRVLSGVSMSNLSFKLWRPKLLATSSELVLKGTSKSIVHDWHNLYILRCAGPNQFICQQAYDPKAGSFKSVSSIASGSVASSAAPKPDADGKGKGKGKASASAAPADKAGKGKATAAEAACPAANPAAPGGR